MSDMAYTPHVKNARARTLGDAVPVIRPFRDAEPKIVAKTSDELRADREAALAAELKDARQDVTRANSRWLAAIKAFKAHDVIQQIGDDGVAA